MPEIDSLAKDFESEINDADITVESEVDHNQTIDSNQDQTTKEQSTDSTYNFDKTTVILGLQILPATAQSERQVLLSAGIKGSPPIISSTTLTHIEQAEALVDILEKLKQSLPHIAERAKLRQQLKHQNILQQKQPQRVATTPELPPPHSTPSLPSSQLSLF